MPMTSTSRPYNPYANNGGARVGSGRKPALSVAEQARLGRRVYEVIFGARMNILFALYPHHKAGLAKCRNAKDLSAYCRKHRIVEPKRAHKDDAMQIVWDEAQKDDRVKTKLTPRAVQTWANVYRSEHREHYIAHFCT